MCDVLKYLLLLQKIQKRWKEKTKELLTERERAILMLAGQGKTTKNIANCLHKGYSTIHNQIERLFSKLNVHSMPEAILLLQYVKETYPDKRSIDLSQLAFRLCVDYRVSCNNAKEFIINEYKAKTDSISLVRTSEIFIKEKEFSKKEKVFYPKYKDSYISHIILRT
jgi:DNA-binding CsgD family transcriptional regulator